MKKILLAATLLTLVGCARPYGPADKVLSTKYAEKKENVVQSKITVTRNKQFIGGGSGGTCRFVVAIDETDIALLRQNQFAVAYLDKGPHKLKVSNDCNVLSMGMRKTLDIIADGTDQEYVTENGFWGQYRMWQVK
ncbi:hypothetical protein ACAY19_001381 [Serratia liquefaciens]|jgi:ribose 5-phosphate isomerase